MGFTQSTRRVTGMESLWCRLREFSSQETWVLPPLPWDTDAEAIAALIHRNAAPEASIYVMPYSWGCGQFFIDFAKACVPLGREIRHAVLCDGVYRSRTLPTWITLNFLSLTGIPKLSIPASVREVTWFYQRKGVPAGHVPVARDPSRTRINPGIQLDLRHDEMDDAPAYQDAVMRLAAETAGPSV